VPRNIWHCVGGVPLPGPPSKRWQWVGAKRSAAEDRRRPYQLPIPFSRALIKDRNRPIACLNTLQLLLRGPGPGCWHRSPPLVSNAPLIHHHNTSLTAFLRSFAYRLPPHCNPRLYQRSQGSEGREEYSDEPLHNQASKRA
jgi:hypothetical protein